MKVFPILSDKGQSWLINVIVYALKIIGLAPFSLQHTNNSTGNSRNDGCFTSVFIFSKIGLAYNILLSILVLVMCTLALPELSSIRYPNKSSITHAIDVTQDTLRTLTICIIIVSGAFKQKQAISIANRLLEVDRQLSGVEKHPVSKKTSFKFLAVEMVFNALIWVTFWASEEVYVKSFLHWFIFNVPIFVMHSFVVEYSIVLGFLVREFESLNKNLLNFKEFPNYLFHTPVPYQSASTIPTSCRQLAALELLHNIRTTLSEVSQDIADFFSFPTLPAVGCFSLTLVYNFYYLITPIVIPSSDIPMSTNINAVAWILACVYPLVLLSINVTKTSKEARLTGPVIHKLLAKARGREIRTELERFSLQLLHENLSFTAHGFFTLDFTLIQSVNITQYLGLCLLLKEISSEIFGVTATYLVIVVQFMQSAANTAKNTPCQFQIE